MKRLLPIWAHVLSLIFLSNAGLLAQGVPIFDAVSPPNAYWNQTMIWESNQSQLTIRFRIEGYDSSSGHQMRVFNVLLPSIRPEIKQVEGPLFEAIVPLQKESLNRIIVSLTDPHNGRLMIRSQIEVEQINKRLRSPDLDERMLIAIDGPVRQEGDSCWMESQKTDLTQVSYKVFYQGKWQKPKNLHARAYNLQSLEGYSPPDPNKGNLLTLPLEPGDNEFSLRISHAPSGQSQKIWLSIPREETNLSILGQSYSLFIVNDQYPEKSQWTNLKTAGQNARALDSLLQARYGFQPGDIHYNPDKKGIREILKDYRDPNKNWHPQDQLVIFFSGHGELDDFGSNSYYAPNDAIMGDPNYNNYYGFHEMLNIISGIPCQHILLVLDACYSGVNQSGVRDLIAIKGNLRKQQLNVRKYLNCQEQVLISSADLKSPASDIPRGSQGVSDFVLGMMNYLGDQDVLDKKGYIPASELFRYLQSLDMSASPQARRFGMDSGQCDFIFFDPKFRQK